MPAAAPATRPPVPPDDAGAPRPSAADAIEAGAPPMPEPALEFVDAAPAAAAPVAEAVAPADVSPPAWHPETESPAPEPAAEEPAAEEPVAAAQPVPANDVVSGPVIQPIVIGSESAPPVERKRGWWRR